MMFTFNNYQIRAKLIGFILIFSLAFLASCNDNPTGNGGDINKPSPNRLDTGQSAHDFLSADYHTKLMIEIQYAYGFKPRQQAVDSLITFLNRYLHKPDGIRYMYDSIPDPGKSTYSINDIEKIEDQNRTEYNSGKTIASYILFIDGGSTQDSGNSRILGEAYRNTSMVIYEQNVRDLSGDFNQPSQAKLEATVMRHEFGHDLGLVNLGTPMVTNHEDPNHPNHCTVKSCLMYWNVNTSNVISNITGGTIPKLDPYCRADLKANGGK